MFLGKEEMLKRKYANSGNLSITVYAILINKLIIILIIKEYILYLETEEGKTRIYKRRNSTRCKIERLNRPTYGRKKEIFAAYVVTIQIYADTCKYMYTLHISGELCVF